MEAYVHKVQYYETDNRILAESLMLGLKAFDEDIEV
jgi:hypothetical protein